jgi:hypothetical protein
MNNRTNILNELNNISPLVAGIGSKNVFSVPEGYFDSISPTVLLSVKEEAPVLPGAAPVPEGYFDNLAGNILNKIKSQAAENAEELPALLSQVKKNALFEVPAGYFDSLSGNVLAAINNQQEELPKIFERLSKTVPFEVPTGYFESVADQVLSAIKLGEEDILPPLLKDAKTATPFDIPQGYFNTLSDHIISRIKNGEENVLPQIFTGLSNKAPFEVPLGYFDNLSNQILAKIKNTSEAKVVKMSVRFRVLKYAAAAIITGVLALGIYKFTGNTVNQAGAGTAALDPSILKGKAMSDKVFTESMDNLSEEAIVKYLEKNGSDADVSALTSNMENITLPQQEDYLLDENTLDDFLNDIKSNSN